jgi:hypothetical protein
VTILAVDELTYELINGTEQTRRGKQQLSAQVEPNAKVRDRSATA